MELEVIFTIVNTVALLSWVLLFAFYHTHWVYPTLFSGVIVFLAIVYLYYISVGFTGGAEGGFNSLREVRMLFQDDHALLGGWVHYLAFDLFVGMWVAKDSLYRKINRWLLLPCLFLTFMLGPVGLLVYLVIRAMKAGEVVQYPFAKSTDFAP
ncbi:ABA4-like family protein [Litoribacter populi]|uniref:ABA4-like family protein n=1 Tax=Litoribacter populi TaxID=2598460 RepID=UPI00118137E0|nr:ABA4-like family protein [Litoribacter populi]